MPYTAYKVTSSRNAYGDLVASGETAIKCNWRKINRQVVGNNNETYQSDAMGWFEQDSGVQKGDIIKFDGEHYRVEKRVEATKRLRGGITEFIKTEMSLYGVIS